MRALLLLLAPALALADAAVPGAPSGRRPPEVLASGQVSPAAIAVDERAVYWATGDGHVRAVSKQGGAVVELAALPAFGLAVRGDQLWMGGRHGLFRVPRGGGAVATVVSLAARDDDPLQPISDGRRVYYDTFRGELASVPLAGGPPIVYGRNERPGDLVADGGFLYWTDWRDGAVYRAPAGGGGAVAIVRGLRHPIGLAVDERALWIGSEGDGTVLRAPKAGGRAVAVARGQVNHDHLADGGDALYWCSWGGPPAGHAVMRLAKADGRLAVVASGLDEPEGITVDGAFVYVTNKGAGTILKIAR